MSWIFGGGGSGGNNNDDDNDDDYEQYDVDDQIDELERSANSGKVIADFDPQPLIDGAKVSFQHISNLCQKFREFSTKNLSKHKPLKYTNHTKNENQ